MKKISLIISFGFAILFVIAIFAGINPVSADTGTSLTETGSHYCYSADCPGLQFNTDVSYTLDYSYNSHGQSTLSGWNFYFENFYLAAGGYGGYTYAIQITATINIIGSDSTDSSTTYSNTFTWKAGDYGIQAIETNYDKNLYGSFSSYNALGSDISLSGAPVFNGHFNVSITFYFVGAEADPSGVQFSNIDNPQTWGNAIGGQTYSYILTFYELYKPSGSTWTVNVNGNSYSSTGTSISVNIPVASPSYSYTVNSIYYSYYRKSYYPNPSSGLGILSSDYSITVTFSIDFAPV